MADTVRSYHTTDAEYKLPNDAPEHIRLDEQHAGITAVMGGQIIQSPLKDPLHIIDIGCGTGVVSCHLGRTFPTAQVYGIDLSLVPPIHVKPNKVTFIHGDITTLVGQDDRFRAETMDFAFSRLLVAGVADWQSYVNSVVTMVKPGGYIEMQEPEFTYWINGTMVSADWSWLQTFHTVMKKRGMDPAAGHNLAEYFRKAGLVDITTNMYEWPWGDWKARRGYSELRRFGTHLGETMPATWQGMLSKMLEGQGYSANELETLLAQCHKSTQPEEGKYMPWHVVYGRKPM